MEGAAISPAVGEPVANYADHLTDDVPSIIDGEESTTLSVGGDSGDSDVETGDSDTEIASIHTTASRSEGDTADDATTDEPMATSYVVDSPTSPNSEDIEDTTNHEVTIDAPCDEVCSNDGDSVLPSPQEAEQGAKQHGYNLRPTKARDYTHLGHTQFVAEPTSTYRKLVTTLSSLTQMSFKRGLRKHGMEARKAMLKEFAQIKEKEVFSPIKASSLTPTQRRKALRTINLIIEKRDGVLKGRTCVDGRPQRAYIAKEGASSPTMFLDSLTTLLTIFAVEKRHVATAGVSGA